MIERRPATERGHANYGWLDTWHSFSFADYHDPRHMGWGTLRVINDDTVEPGGGFPTHGHRDMEIVSVVLEGALQHRDSMGNGTVIEAGEVQRMSAGSGVTHSEFNPSPTARSRFLQIWIRPRTGGGAPGYEQKRIDPAAAAGRWTVLASGDGRDGSLTVNQDAAILATVLAAGGRIDWPVLGGRLQYVHVVAGEIAANGIALAPGDGAKLRDEARLDLIAKTPAKILLFDLTER
jgi:redox-sensitive bicupin YhaK (pirin superfamily)